MVSLWGSKSDNEHSKPDDDAPRNGEGSRPNSRQPLDQDPDERTRLLPPRNDGFLDPDDPAVSPYNLWSVRALRYFSVIFLVITFLWWVLLLVSLFVSPPKMNARGSGFFDFSYTTLTAGNLLVAILFFSSPSKALQISGGIVAVILLVNMIVILAVARLRFEEGAVGIASVVWATVIALYNVLADRAVQWGKKEEEERLTGRQENRRTLREWCAVLTSFVIMIILIIVTILLTATLILRSRDASLEAPGERYYVDGSKYQVHLACVGNVTYNDDGKRNPTVLLEAGEDPVEGTFEPFIYTTYKNGTIPRYCYWDRPGFGWSDNAPSPYSAGMNEAALSEALAIAGEQGPWVLVSAGVGGIYSRIFASRKVKDIHGIFLIDTLHEDLIYTIASPGRGFVLWARGIISPLGFDRLAGAITKRRTREDRVYGRSAYQSGKYIKAKLQENLVADSLSKSEVSQARTVQSKKTPVTVITSGIEVGKSDDWYRKQEDLTRLTKNLLSWDVVNAAPHEVWRTLEGRTVIENRLGEMVRR
ncbi:hypothetical protein MMC20_007043 [Loxospora ochrophaea]|nr:hypothetical protein [Loxospora ochrophaea]